MITIKHPTLAAKICLIFKKIINLTTFCLLFFSAANFTSAFAYELYTEAYEFDPEAYSFTNSKTLRSWVAEKYLDENMLKNIQNQVGLYFYDNPQAITSNDCLNTHNDDGVIQIFGCNNPSQADLELEFLRFVHEVSKRKSPVTLEIAAGAGTFSWKPFLSWEKKGTHYANELSHTMMDNKFTETIKKHAIALDLNILSSIVKLPGSCFNILNEHPELKNKVDAIYIANLEQFLNPKQHQQLLTLIENLLAPGGRAFLCANACGSEDFSFDEMLSSYEKTTNPYPCFFQTLATFKNEISFTEIETCTTENINTTHILIQKNSDEIISFEDQGVDLYKNSIYRYASNGFSPEIYRRAIALHPNLQIINSFFADSSGRRYTNETYLVTKETPTKATAIIEKNGRSWSSLYI